MTIPVREAQYITVPKWSINNGHYERLFTVKDLEDADERMVAVRENQI